MDGACSATAVAVCGEDVKLVSDLNALKFDVDCVKEELNNVKVALNGLREVESRPCTAKPCFIYVRLKASCYPPPGRSGLELILGCKILQYALVRLEPTPAYKVKINSLSLSDALFNAWHQGCFADIWMSSTSFSPRNSVDGHQVCDTGVTGQGGKLKVAS